MPGPKPLPIGAGITVVGVGASGESESFSEGEAMLQGELFATRPAAVTKHGEGPMSRSEQPCSEKISTTGQSSSSIVGPGDAAVVGGVVSAQNRRRATEVILQISERAGAVHGLVDVAADDPEMAPLARVPFVAEKAGKLAGDVVVRSGALDPVPVFLTTGKPLGVPPSACRPWGVKA